MNWYTSIIQYTTLPYESHIDRNANKTSVSSFSLLKLFALLIVQ